MARQRITTYAMLTPECRLQLEEEIWDRLVAHVAGGLPSNLLEPKEETQYHPEVKQDPRPMEGADPEANDTTEAKEEEPTVGFAMGNTMT